MRKTRKIAGVAIGAAAMIGIAAGPAMADGTYTGTLSPVPGNGGAGSGTVKITVTGDTIDYTLSVSGLLNDPPNSAHAAHLHFAATASHTCPTIAVDGTSTAKNTSKNGHIEVSEAIPNYGGIVVSLTKTGDTSPASALMPLSQFDADGTFTYTRTGITVDSTTAKAIEAGQGVVVVHGVDLNGNGKYDTAAGASDLDASLPAEATDPALCGVVSASPAGGMATGEGGAQGGQDGLLIGLGSILLVGAAGTGVAAARRRKVRA